MADPEALIGELLDFAEQHLPADRLYLARRELEAGEWYLALYYAMVDVEEAGLLPPPSLLVALREEMARAYPDRRYDDLDVRDTLERACGRGGSPPAVTGER